MGRKIQSVEFTGSHGNKLVAKLDLPDGEIHAYAIFAHCFTCSKEINSTRRISAELADRSIAVLRFDFTGLGKSDGEFSETNFSSNIEDLLAAAQFLREEYAPPQIIIGHSLGGAAAISAAAQIPEAKAVVTIGAPANTEHVVQVFGEKTSEIEDRGEAIVNLAGREFSIRRQFLADLKKTSVTARAAKLGKALLILHSPVDTTVGIENAQEIFIAARHPKSFISLDRADHLLTKPEDAKFAAGMIAEWAARYTDQLETDEDEAVEGVLVRETGKSKFHNIAIAGKHKIIADEPKSVGGTNEGPSPYDLLAMALGTCTNMTIRMYAEFKKLPIGNISVHVDHKKIHAKDCEICTQDQREGGGKIDVFDRSITVEGLDDPEISQKLLKIADKCPVHKTLSKGAKITTKLAP